MHLRIKPELTKRWANTAVNLNDSPYFGALRARLDQLSQRQTRIAENIANASTPGYVPRDIDTKRFEDALARAAQRSDGGRIAMTRTHAAHMPTAAGTLNAQARTIARPDSETTLDGNAVVLEEQTMRAAETRMAFETNLSLYQKGLQLVRMAARPPGR